MFQSIPLPSKISLHQIQVRCLNYSRYQSIRPLLTMGQGGLLLGVGVGVGEFRFRTYFLPKNRSGSGEVVSAGIFQVGY
jgi:hypothetical protein